MTKELNPIDVLKNVETLVEQYDKLQEERDDAFDQVDELENERDELQERVDELEEENNELKERVEQVRDILRAIASDLGTLLSAVKRDKADGMRFETYQTLCTLNTTINDLTNYVTAWLE